MPPFGRAPWLPSLPATVDFHACQAVTPLVEPAGHGCFAVPSPAVQYPGGGVTTDDHIAVTCCREFSSYHNSRPPGSLVYLAGIIINQ